MPRMVPQHLKSLAHINLQPDKMTPKTRVIMYFDVGGMTNKKIAESVGMTESRVSIIRNCPMYVAQRTELEDSLKKQIIDKQSDKIVSGDPVENKIKDACLDAAQKKIDLMEAGSEFVQNAASSDILAIGGYQRKTSKTTQVIEVDSKMADRWERVLGDSPKPGRTKITIVKEEKE